MFELKGAFGKRAVGVMGARAEVRDVDAMLKTLSAIDEKAHTVGQIFNADRIAGKEHLIHAARLALYAQAMRTGFAGSLNIELVCWASGLRQIAQAFERVGLRKGCRQVAILTIGNTREVVKRAQAKILQELCVKRDDKVIDITPKKIPALMKTFNITKRELKIADVQKLVLEKVALLSLQR